MFGLGWGEIVVIGIVALIAIGPKELPTVLRTLGQSLAKVRRMAAEFQGQFQEALREAEMTDLKKQAEDLKSSVGDFTNFDPMADTKQEIERAFELPDEAAKETAKETAKPGELAAAPSADAALPTPASSDRPPAAPAEVIALPEVTPLPQIDVPLPEPPAPVSEKDFATAEPAPPQAPQKAAGGGA